MEPLRAGGARGAETRCAVTVVGCAERGSARVPAGGPRRGGRWDKSPLGRAAGQATAVRNAVMGVAPRKCHSNQ